MKELRMIFREILTMIIFILLLSVIVAPHYHQCKQVVTNFLYATNR